MHLIVVSVPETEDEDWNDKYNQALDSLDDASRTKVKKYYRKVDSWRSLLGRLVVRQLFTSRGVKSNELSLSFTSFKKPFLSSPSIGSRIAFNISHDENLVVVGYETDTHDELCIGVDIMRMKLPRSTTLEGFVDIMTDQMSAKEIEDLQTSLANDPPEVTLKRIFWLWTLKEAYTKALGEGLGFELGRISVDLPALSITVDGSPLTGFDFLMFEIALKDPQGGQQEYQGVLVRKLPDCKAPISIIRKAAVYGEQHDWVEFRDPRTVVDASA